MKLYFIFISICLNSVSFSSCLLLNPGDYCLKSELNKNCVAYDCGYKFCAFEKEPCQYLKTWEILLKRYIKEPNSYTSFVEGIKPCSRAMFINQWSHRISFG